MPGAEAAIPSWLAANLAVAGVAAGTTTRDGGVSEGAFRSLNLGAHVGDDPAAVAANRRRLAERLALPSEPLWLNQVHGTRVVEHTGSGPAPEADAAVTFAPGRVLAVLTADCLPVVLASRDGQRLGVAHAGWRGLAAGVLERTVEALGVPGRELVAWLGPAIGPNAFEVGGEVREAFLATDPGAGVAFTPNERGRWQADLAGLARRRLEALGLATVTGGGECTYTDAGRFYSFRREPRTGRLATLAWIRGTGVD